MNRSGDILFKRALCTEDLNFIEKNYYFKLECTPPLSYCGCVTTLEMNQKNMNEEDNTFQD
jgi:hypothetical protein